MPWTARYDESPERAAECLRLALPMMTRHGARPHPLSYAVWYEHVRGGNRPLSAAIEAATTDGGKLDEAATLRLYREHVVPADVATADRVAGGVLGMLDAVGDSARDAAGQSARFDASLQRWQAAMERGTDEARAESGVLQADTEAMRRAVGALQERLESARGEVDRLRDELNRAREEALLDVLTGLPNRRAFDLGLQAVLAAGTAPGCLLVADIDHFKRVNDNYGHLFGDQVLRVVAQALRGCVEAGQLAARVGGEEFAVLLPDTRLAQAQALAERIRATVASSRIRRREGGEPLGQVTLSLGVAARRAGEPQEAWFDRADRALYAAKHDGRNRVVVAH